MNAPVEGECMVHGFGAGVESLAAKLTDSAESKTRKDVGSLMVSVRVPTAGQMRALFNERTRKRDAQCRIETTGGQVCELELMSACPCRGGWMMKLSGVESAQPSERHRCRQ